jgi:hypothetical protein
MSNTLKKKQLGALVNLEPLLVLYTLAVSWSQGHISKAVARCNVREHLNATAWHERERSRNCRSDCGMQPETLK